MHLKAHDASFYCWGRAVAHWKAPLISPPSADADSGLGLAPQRNNRGWSCRPFTVLFSTNLLLARDSIR